ncbi:MAG: biopolymer transporter ExbD, partial [candidate division KSB1 bacterium]|nr:biopolymer transporter ExbD [candidate division KSB1 bacterium]
MKIQTTRKRMVHFQTVSLTDIVLLLLIFFLLTSSFVVQPGIKIKLPKAASGAQDDSDKIFITVTQRERIYLNQQPVTREELGARLRQIFSKTPDKLVVIRADKDISLETTIRIIDTA